MTAKDDLQERLYREAMGKEAAARQQQLAKETCSQCGGKNGQHHQMCKRRKT